MLNGVDSPFKPMTVYRRGRRDLLCHPVAAFKFYKSCPVVKGAAWGICLPLLDIQLHCLQRGVQMFSQILEVSFSRHVNLYRRT